MGSFSRNPLRGRCDLGGSKISGASGLACVEQSSTRRWWNERKNVESLCYGTPVAGLSNDGAILRDTVRKRGDYRSDGIHSRVRRGAAWTRMRGKKSGSRRDGIIE